MGWLPFALSIHHFISSVGADAGFASIIGLAILVLLYFAQARETARLRDQALESARRIQELETRLAPASQQPQPSAPQAAPARPATAAAAAAPVAYAGSRDQPRVPARAPAPAPPPAGAAAPVPAPVLATAPGPPAGVAAPALSAATKAISSDSAQGPGPAAPADGDREERVPDGTVIAPAPATVAGASNGAAKQEQLVAPGVQNRAAPQPVGMPLGRAPAPPRQPVRPTAPASHRAVVPPPSAPRGSRIPRGFALLMAALVIAAGIAVLFIVTNSGGSRKTASGTSTTNAPGTHRATRAPAINPATISVSVLNGTATTGLAHRTATRLAAAGYKQGTVVNAADQTHTTTVVAYTPGHRQQALEVATTLKLAPSAVQPVDQTTQQVACPPPAGCPSSVIVTVGSDLARG